MIINQCRICNKGHDDFLDAITYGELNPLSLVLDSSICKECMNKYFPGLTLEEAIKMLNDGIPIKE